MPTVNFLRVVGREYVAAKIAVRMKAIEKATEAAREAYESLSV